MAGASLGASIAPFSPVNFPTVLATRSKRLHGAFCIETTLARVWSSRRFGEPAGVLLALSTDTPAELTGRYTPEQARRIARVLTDAAAAVELLTTPAPATSTPLASLPPLPPLRSRATRPHFSDRPFGFDPRWQVRHGQPCGEPAERLPAPRCIGGGVARLLKAGAGREGGAA